ncbi:MAG: ABC transporter permease [Rhodopirellula sp.]|nr:ABC transporter permease [Rhodopirellula sp.]
MPTHNTSPNPHRPPNDARFYAALGVLGGFYVLVIVALLLADLAYMATSDATEAGWMPDVARRISPWPAVARAPANVLVNLLAALAKPEIRYAIVLSLVSCTITAIVSLWVAVPLGYVLARVPFRGRGLVDLILDIPIVLPPLVLGLSLLILFQFSPRAVREAVVYQVPAVILAQFVVACAFAVRTMQATFQLIDPRREQVALTLGCNRAQAFWRVVLPESKRGIITAGTLAWARALGEFGPLLIFAGATRMKTEVLSTTVFLELSIGNLPAAVAVSMIMIVAAAVVLAIMRLAGSREWIL